MPAAIPSVTYSHPNIARVGLTEKEAENGNLPVNIIRSEYGANILARSELAGSGFAKFLFHNDLFVGATIIGEQAAELISPLALAIANSMHKADLKRWVIPHPTLSELLAI
jgi:dihydrolipoamide dehydrogenase